LSTVTARATLAHMRTGTKALVASLIAAFALAAASSLAAAPADAHYLSSSKKIPDRHLNLLRFPKPKNPGWKPCIHRTVRLRAGYWHHNAYIVSERSRNCPDINRNEESALILRSGKYYWTACRWWITSRTYRVSSTLLRRHQVIDYSENDLDPKFMKHANKHAGMYEWGGRIAFDREVGTTNPSR
jgi:hypothetical protein